MKTKILSFVSLLLMAVAPVTFVSCDPEELEEVINGLDATLNGNALDNTAWIVRNGSDYIIYAFYGQGKGGYVYHVNGEHAEGNLTYVVVPKTGRLIINIDGEKEEYYVADFVAGSSLVLQYTENGQKYTITLTAYSGTGAGTQSASIVGRWYISGNNVSSIYTFNSDGTGLLIFNGTGGSEGYYITYTLNSSTRLLTIRYPDGGSEQFYVQSITATTMVLTDVSGKNKYVFTRVQSSNALMQATHLDSTPSSATALSILHQKSYSHESFTRH